MLGGFTGVHQFVKIGAHVMAGVSCVVRRTSRPTSRSRAIPARRTASTPKGLKRRGFTPEAIAALKRAYKTLYKSGLTLAEAKAELARRRREAPEVPADRRIPRHLHARHPEVTRIEPRIAIVLVAGEASGDLLGAALIRALQQRAIPTWSSSASPGPRMMADGARTLYPMEKLAVRGYVEVLKRLPRDRCASARGLARAPPRGPARPVHRHRRAGLQPRRSRARLKRAGIPTVHYVSPSIWAWRAGAHPRRSRAPSTTCWWCSRSRQPIYEKAGIPATYVGHPLADAMPLEPDRAEARVAAAPARRGHCRWRCCPAAA